jgi:hypothetical protein
MRPAPPPLIDAELAAFMQRGVSLTVGSCDAANRPSLARATGCRVAADGSTVRLFISGVQAAPLLAHVRETGRLAAVFSQPSTHRTLQLKGLDAKVEPAGPDDLAVVRRYRDAFVDELARLGYPRPVFHALLACPDADLVALRFTPTEAFSQTPGPNAGRSLQAPA